MAEGLGEERKPPWPAAIGGVFGILVALYLFMVGISLMEDVFVCLGGSFAGQLFSHARDPIGGLWVGVVATVLLQSSTASTAVVVSLVSAEQMTARTAIPVAMGANVGASLPSTLVALGRAGDRIERARALSIATLHDLFNMLTVLALLPIEIVTSSASGEGGLLYWVSKRLTEVFVGDSQRGGRSGGGMWGSPVAAMAKPVSRAVLGSSRLAVEALALAPPEAIPLSDGEYNATLCDGTRRLDAAEPLEPQWDGWRFAGGGLEAANDASQAGLRRLVAEGNGTDCSRYYCVSATQDDHFHRLGAAAYAAELTACADYVLEPRCSDQARCYLDAGAYYQRHIAGAPVIDGGVVIGAGKPIGCTIALIFCLVLIYGSQAGLVVSLEQILTRRTRRLLNDSFGQKSLTGLIDCLGSALVAFIAQSSAVVTSVFVPLWSTGVLPLERVYLQTVGANIGASLVGFVAACTTMKFGAVQIAWCGVLFNGLGFCICYLAKPARRRVLDLARLLGLYASFFYQPVPLLYILAVFGMLPAILWYVSAMFQVHVVNGVILVLVLVAVLLAFEEWWVNEGTCYRVLSQYHRAVRLEQWERADRRMRGAEDPEETPAWAEPISIVPGGLRVAWT